jgi:hypothetical protein
MFKIFPFCQSIQYLEQILGEAIDLYNNILSMIFEKRLISGAI